MSIPDPSIHFVHLQFRRFYGGLNNLLEGLTPPVIA